MRKKYFSLLQANTCNFHFRSNSTKETTICVDQKEAQFRIVCREEGRTLAEKIMSVQ